MVCFKALGKQEDFAASSIDFVILDNSVKTFMKGDSDSAKSSEGVGVTISQQGALLGVYTYNF